MKVDQFFCDICKSQFIPQVGDDAVTKFAFELRGPQAIEPIDLMHVCGKCGRSIDDLIAVLKEE